MNKHKSNRLRRAKRPRLHMRALGKNRLCVFRSTQHIYAQILSPDSSQTLVAVSTLEKAVGKDLKCTSNVEAARKVGAEIAKRAKDKGISTVAFDRSGFKYHGRVKALADAAREGGLQF